MFNIGIQFADDKFDIFEEKRIAAAEKCEATQPAQIHRVICTWFSIFVEVWTAQKGRSPCDSVPYKTKQICNAIPLCECRCD